MSNLEILNATNGASYMAKAPLQGGDLGQVLVKASTTDFDYHWSSLPSPSLTPPVNTYQVSPFIISSTTSAQTVGRLNMYPFWVGNAGYSTNAFRINVTTAQSGGTASLEVALYANDPANDIPDGTQKLASTTGFTLTVSGSTAATFTQIDLKQGLYWLATLYTESSSPSTAPIFTSIQSAQNILAQAATDIGNPSRAYYLSSQSSMPTSGINPTSLTPSTNTDPIIVGVYRST